MTDSRRSAAVTQIAFVLHSHDWSESSLILELFTRDAGRVVAAAKGAKRPTSQLRAVLMPFQRIAVQFARSRGDDGSRGAHAAQCRMGRRGGADARCGLVRRLLSQRAAAAPAGARRCAPAPVRCLRRRAGLRSATAKPARSRRCAPSSCCCCSETGVLPELHRTTLTQAPVQADRRYVLRSDQGLAEAAVGRHRTRRRALPGAGCRAAGVVERRG